MKPIEEIAKRIVNYTNPIEDFCPDEQYFAMISGMVIEVTKILREELAQPSPSADMESRAGEFAKKHVGPIQRIENYEVGMNLEQIAKMLTIFAQQELNKWISVEESLPETLKEVILTKNDTSFSGYYDGNSKRFFNSNHNWILGVSAWQPLPKPNQD